jgi:hypothetical protein
VKRLKFQETLSTTHFSLEGPGEMGLNQNFHTSQSCIAS